VNTTARCCEVIARLEADLSVPSCSSTACLWDFCRTRPRTVPPFLLMAPLPYRLPPVERPVAVMAGIETEVRAGGLREHSAGRVCWKSHGSELGHSTLLVPTILSCSMTNDGISSRRQHLRRAPGAAGACWLSDRYALAAVGPFAGCALTSSSVPVQKWERIGSSSWELEHDEDLLLRSAGGTLLSSSQLAVTSDSCLLARPGMLPPPSASPL
jgi:hypothetical protein